MITKEHMDIVTSTDVVNMDGKVIIEDQPDLPKALTERLSDPNLDENYTVGDFFDEMKIPGEMRTGFAVACILRQAMLAYGNPKS